MLNDFRVEINLIKVFIKQMHIYIDCEEMYLN
jgi:hypothetical protein